VKRSSHVGLLLSGCAIWLAVAGCVSQGVEDTVNQRTNHGMTTSELKVARAAALRQARREGAKVTARATVSGVAASPRPSGPPGPCRSGRLLHITLVGQFPHAPHAGDTGSTPARGQDLTVDATSGQVCESHYVTGVNMTDPTSVLLFSL